MKNVLNHKKTAFWITIAAVVACIVIAVCFFTNPKRAKGVEAEERYNNVSSVERDEQTRAIYAATLRSLLYKNILPDGEQAEMPADNFSQFAVADIDTDGKEELILLYDSGVMADSIGYIIGYDSGVMADSIGYIIGYDSERQDIYIQLKEFPYFAFLENGNLKALASHNHTYGEMWPYALYQYLPERDSYQLRGYASAEDRSFLESCGTAEEYHDSVDISGTGTVYYVGEGTWGESPIDEKDYMKWLEDNQGNAAEIAIEYLPLNEESILKIE